MHEMCVCVWGGRKKIGLYDLIEIKRATARINRRAWRLGYEGMYSAERRVADFCSRLIKAGGANISHASGGALRPLQPCSSPGSASPPTYENVTPPTDGTLAVSNVNLLIQLCVFTIWSLQRRWGGGGTAFLSPGQCRVPQAACFDIGAGTKLHPFFFCFFLK